MEPHLSVLLYSKYSASSKKLMDLMRMSQIDFTTMFSLQSLCIDNEQIREKILKNEQINVTSVPCILVIYPDGGIEKYDGMHAFEWVEQIIQKVNPPMPEPPQHRGPPPKTQEEIWEEEEEKERLQIRQLQLKKERERERIRDENKRNYEEQYESQQEKPKPRNRRQRIKKPETPPKKAGITNIDELSTDEDDDDMPTDRYRHRKPVGSIREDSGNYNRTNDLFPGTPPDNRKSTKSAVKGVSISAKEQKTLDIMAKAKELAKGREDSNPPPPPGHPAGKME